MTAADATTSSLLTVALSLLDQCSDLLDKLSDSSQLTHHPPDMPSSTIGKHLRHLHDHYSLLASAAQDAGPSSSPIQLNYDKRSRNGMAESDLQAARKSFVELKDRLKAVAPNWASAQPLALSAVTPFEVTTMSSLGRELWFCSLHAVHHLAYVRNLAAELDLNLPAGFGVAPSTLVHQKQPSPPGKL